MEYSTIAAIATAPGAGGIAVVRLSGPESYAVAAKVFHPANPAKRVEEAKCNPWCLRKLYLTDKRNDPYSIAIVNTYLFLKEEEIYKLTTALECIRYGLTKGKTLGYLGGVNQ